MGACGGIYGMGVFLEATTPATYVFTMPITHILKVGYMPQSTLDFCNNSKGIAGVRKDGSVYKLPQGDYLWLPPGMLHMALCHSKSR